MISDLDLAEVYTKGQTKCFSEAETIDSSTLGLAHVAGLRAVFESGCSRPQAHIVEANETEIAAYEAVLALIRKRFGSARKPPEDTEPTVQFASLEAVAADLEKRAHLTEKWGDSGKAMSGAFREIAKDIRDGKYSPNV